MYVCMYVYIYMSIDITYIYIYIYLHTPNLPNIIPTKIVRLKLSGKSPVDMRIPPLTFNIMLESNPLKSIHVSTEIGRILEYFLFCPERPGLAS